MSIYTTCDGPGLCIVSNMGLTDSLVPVLMLPISRPQGDMTEEELAAAAGCDLVEDLPSLLPWLTENAFKFKKVTVGCYVYMDGEAHVRAAVAMDLIVTGLVASGKGKGVEVSVAYLGSPATCYPIPTECHAAMAQARSDAPFWHHMADFWGTRKSIKKKYPKSVAHGAKRVPKWSHFRSQIEGKFKEKSRTLFLTLPGTLLGSILDPCWYLF